MSRFSFPEMVISFAATYWLHSTILISACWITVSILRLSSHHLLDRLWKVAGLLGLVTAAAQTGLGAGPTIDIHRLVSTGTLVKGAPSELTGGSSRGAPNRLAEQTSAVSSIEQRWSTRDQGRGVDAATANEPHLGRAKIGATSESLKSTEDLPFGLGSSSQTASINRAMDALSLEKIAWISNRSGERSGVPSYVMQMASAAVILAFGVGALFVGWRAFRFRRTLRNATVLQHGPARRALDRLLKRNKIRRNVRLLISSRHAEPFAFGLFQWTIVLPTMIEERLGPEELRALLAHETAHLVRGDVYWLWIGQVLCSCLAFQPLNFLARRRWQQAAEYLCDQWAVERGVRTLSLARCLAQIAEWRFSSQPKIVGLTAGGSRATLVGRVERLIARESLTDRWASPMRHRLISFGAVACIPLLVSGVPRIGLAITSPETAAAASTFHPFTSPDLPVRPKSQQAWKALNDELVELKTELDHAGDLANSKSISPAGQELMHTIRQRSVELDDRRERILSVAFGKESGR